jgi:O-antigen ligase
MSTADSFGLSPSHAIPSRSGGTLIASQNLLNAWLFVILAVGTLFVLTDGLTKPYNIDWEISQEEALSHEATLAAELFAAVMLPLVVLYTRRARGSYQEAVLLWFLLCTTAYSKDFAYIHIPDVPLYISDYVLAVLLFTVFIWPKLRWFPLRQSPVPSLLLLFAIGLLAAARGIAGGQETIFVFRDLAMVVYSLFMVVGLALYRDWKSLYRLLVILCIGSVFLSLNAFGWLMNAPGQRRYIVQNGAGTLVLMCLIFLLLATLNRLVPVLLGWLGTAVLGVGVFLANSRGLFVSLAAALLLVMVFGSSLKKQAILGRLKGLAGVLLIATLSLAVALQTKAGQELADRSLEEFVSGVLHSEDDPQAQFRFLAWVEALDRFSKSPVLGEGYGVPFTFDIFHSDPRPHNTFLTFLYKTGAVGFLVLAAILGRLFVRGGKTALRLRHYPQAGLLYGLLLGLVAVFCAGMFTFIFESPYLACVVWIAMAGCFRMMVLLEAASQHLPEAGNAMG